MVRLAHPRLAGGGDPGDAARVHPRAFEALTEGIAVASDGADFAMSSWTA